MVKNLRRLASKFDLDQIERKPLQVNASACKAKRSRNQTQVFNLGLFATPMVQGLMPSNLQYSAIAQVIYPFSHLPTVDLLFNPATILHVMLMQVQSSWLISIIII